MNEEKTIKQLSYTDDHGMTCTYSVGKDDVVKIVENRARGEGDKWYYDIERESYEGGKETIRRFSFDEVIFYT